MPTTFAPRTPRQEARGWQRQNATVGRVESASPLSEVPCLAAPWPQNKSSTWSPSCDQSSSSSSISGSTGTPTFGKRIRFRRPLREGAEAKAFSTRTSSDSEESKIRALTCARGRQDLQVSSLCLTSHAFCLSRLGPAHTSGFNALPKPPWPSPGALGLKVQVGSETAGRLQVGSGLQGQRELLSSPVRVLPGVEPCEVDAQVDFASWPKENS